MKARHKRNLEVTFDNQSARHKLKYLKRKLGAREGVRAFARMMPGYIIKDRTILEPFNYKYLELGRPKKAGGRRPKSEELWYRNQ